MNLKKISHSMILYHEKNEIKVNLLSILVVAVLLFLLFLAKTKENVFFSNLITFAYVSVFIYMLLMKLIIFVNKLLK
jgi:hypothetical protein